ncbi:MAG: N-acetylglucosamine-6-phosphate deacetylase [Ignavibacteriales bacterium]|nr:N-acetylglucosamine-6-phosphate deacetylase [Ignavibacteriales bacterium]MCF8435386.1 N-acetylglucosamine-6-phosphate deacetylase [Ignavibacteriales bacterium]
MGIALVAGKIVTPFRVIENGAITISNDKIHEVGSAETINIRTGLEVINAKGHLIVPGFVDLLVHGGAGGYGFSDENDQSIDKIAKYFLSHGSTSVMASLHAKPKERLLQDFRRLAGYIENNPELNIRGIHMEGPYLNPELKGAMNKEYLWEPSIDSFLEMYEASRGYLKIMTIAPELPGALDVIREAAFRGVVSSIGHSTASYEQIDQAIDYGATHITHMFNAMKPLHHRTPSVVTAALLRDELKIELIADTYHVHPAVMEMLIKFKTAKGIVLITDSIRVGGLHEGEESQFSDQKVVVKGNKAVMEDGTIAGSTLTLNKAIKNLLETTSVSLTDAVRMATLNGAKVIGSGRGIIAAGKVADLVVMNNNFDVVMTIIDGRIKYRSERF